MLAVYSVANGASIVSPVIFTVQALPGWKGGGARNQCDCDRISPHPRVQRG